MKRLVGFLVFAILAGGAVWIGLASGRDAPASRVADVHELIRQLSDNGFGCGDVETNVPGVLGLRDVRLATCEIEDSKATLYVFRGSSALFARGYETGTAISWAVGENWVVVVDKPALSIAIADALGAEPLWDPARVAEASTGLGLQCPEGDLIQVTEILASYAGRGPGKTPVDAVREVMHGLRPTDELVAAPGRRRVDVGIYRDGQLIGTVETHAGRKGGWFAGGTSTCASSEISRG